MDPFAPQSPWAWASLDDDIDKVRCRGHGAIGAQAFNCLQFYKSTRAPVSQPCCRSPPGLFRGRLVKVGCREDFGLVLRAMTHAKTVLGWANPRRSTTCFAACVFVGLETPGTPLLMARLRTRSLWRTSH